MTSRTFLSFFSLLSLIFIGSCNKVNTYTKPTAEFTVSPYSGNLQTTFTFNASQSHDNTQSNTNMQYRWDYQNDGIWDTQWSSNSTLQHQYQKTGYYTVGLEVQDNNGLTDWVSRNLIVTDGSSGDNNSPFASFTISPTSGPVGTVFTFDASDVSDLQENSSSLQVRWDFENDGNWDTPFTTNKTITKQYSTAATYTIKLEVKDNDGNISSTLRTLTVGEANNSTLKFADVAGGTFQMGCTELHSGDCNFDEKPIHSVTVSSFKLSKYEVTNAQYAAFLNSVGANADGSVGSKTYIFIGQQYCNITYVNNQFSPVQGADNLPAMVVSWDGAKAFCEWVGGRLPTEAEWEFAARGGNSTHGYVYSGSNTLNSVCWNASNTFAHPQDVGTLAPNELGIYDMSGNAMEWCSDWYGWDYYSTSASSNPTGPISGEDKVVRGGSVFNGADDCRVSDRYSLSPSNAHKEVGFRVAK